MNGLAEPNLNLKKEEKHKPLYAYNYGNSFKHIHFCVIGEYLHEIG